MTWRKREIMEAQAVAKQEQGEPVAIVEEVSHNGYLYREVVWKIRPHELPIGTEIYTTPQQRTWVGLTNEELRQIWYDDAPVEGGTYVDKLRQVEAKLKGKNT